MGLWIRLVLISRIDGHNYCTFVGKALMYENYSLSSVLGIGHHICYLLSSGSGRYNLYCTLLATSFWKVDLTLLSKTKKHLLLVDLVVQNC